MEKQCGVCRQVLPLAFFYECPRNTDGHAGRCIGCAKAAVEVQRQRKRAMGLSVNARMPKLGVVPDITRSEIAIERERHKRRVEKEIEVELQPEPPPVEFGSGECTWAGLVPVRKGKPGMGWHAA